jgi:peptidoglycan/LPS O-acetylase OafA/YrhL
MRNKRLDVLRCIAVVIVIAHHANLYHVATKTGWVGVDLFFVLSGFLISGLLYSEYKTHRAIDIKRFFIRRGLKIYPALGHVAGDNGSAALVLEAFGPAPAVSLRAFLHPELSLWDLDAHVVSRRRGAFLYRSPAVAADPDS